MAIICLPGCVRGTSPPRFLREDVSGGVHSGKAPTYWAGLEVEAHELMAVVLNVFKSFVF